MSQKIIRVDALGFPIPYSFEDLQPAAPRPPRNGRSARWLRFALVFVGLGLFVGLIFKEQGRKFMADWHARQAEDKFLADNREGALANLDLALLWTPASPQLYYLRAHYRQEAHNLKGSLEDFNKLIVLAPKLPEAYEGRSVVFQRQGLHRRAIDDVTKAISLKSNYDHKLLNHRAYTRAIANLELDEALDDIQQAIRLAGGEDAAYVDTRGYIFHLLDRQDEALVDMERAIELAVKQRQQRLRAVERRRVDPRRIASEKRRLDQNEGVMIYHRGLVHEKLGNLEQAQADKGRGEELGYNPANGVY